MGEVEADRLLWEQQACAVGQDLPAIQGVTNNNADLTN